MYEEYYGQTKKKNILCGTGEFIILLLLLTINIDNKKLECAYK